MDDMSNVSVKAPDRFVAIAGGIAGAIPFVISSTTSSMTSENGHVTSFMYRDNVALVCGVGAAICGLLALVLAIKHKGGRARIGIAAGVLALGGYQVARGLGVFASPGDGAASSSSISITHTEPSELPDRPKQLCADGPACDALGDTKLKSDDVDGALAAFTHGCELKSPDACFDEALLYDQGKLGKTDHVKAMALFDTACQLGSGDGCSNLGVRYLNGSDTAKDPAKAIGLFEKGCKLEVMRSCTNLGIVYRDGAGDAKPDPAKAEEMFGQACDHDWSAACDNLGAMLAQAKATKPKTAALFDKACKLGNLDGCLHFGIALDNGDMGIKTDPKRAREIYGEACDKDMFDACNNLGVMWNTGRGGKKDPAKANELFQKACDHEVKLGCDNLPKPKTPKHPGRPKK